MATAQIRGPKPYTVGGDFDLLQLPTATVEDYKRLVEALKSRFAPTTGEAEIRFQLGRQSTTNRDIGPVRRLISRPDKPTPAMKRSRAKLILTPGSISGYARYSDYVHPREPAGESARDLGQGKRDCKKVGSCPHRP